MDEEQNNYLLFPFQYDVWVIFYLACNGAVNMRKRYNNLREICL